MGNAFKKHNTCAGRFKGERILEHFLGGGFIATLNTVTAENIYRLWG